MIVYTLATLAATTLLASPWLADAIQFRSSHCAAGDKRADQRQLDLRQ